MNGVIFKTRLAIDYAAITFIDAIDDVELVAGRREERGLANKSQVGFQIIIEVSLKC